VLSLIPPMSPMVMPVRIAAGDAPLWQVLLSIVLAIVTIYLLAAIAGRIYRNSVLRMGGRVRLGAALGLAVAASTDAGTSTEAPGAGRQQLM